MPSSQVNWQRGADSEGATGTGQGTGYHLFAPPGTPRAVWRFMCSLASWSRGWMFHDVSVCFLESMNLRNMCVGRQVPSTVPDLLKAILTIPFWTKEEWAGLRSSLYFRKYESAYQEIQGTKPQSLGYGLNDSPVGLLAWILEKFQTCSDCHGGRPEESGLTKDEILTDVMVYWTTQSITSSCRLYYETLGLHPQAEQKSSRSSSRHFGNYVSVPTGVIWSPAEIIKVPRKVAELFFNIKHWSTPSKGGHFFAFATWLLGQVNFNSPRPQTFHRDHQRSSNSFMI